MHANDITRIQYLKLSEPHPEPKANLPDSLILSHITNDETIDHIINPTAFNLEESFRSTVHGKRVAYLLDDFGLKISKVTPLIKEFQSPTGIWYRERLDITISTQLIL